MTIEPIKQVYSQAHSTAFLLTHLQSIAKSYQQTSLITDNDRQSSQLSVDIQLEISSICVNTAVWSHEHITALSNIVHNDCVQQQRDYIPNGYVNVIAQLFRLLTFDVTVTTVLINKLSVQLQSLHDDNVLHNKLKNDIVTILDITITDNIQLGHVLNSASIDVIDMTDLCVEWAMSLYCQQFPEQLFLVTIFNILTTSDTICLIGLLSGLMRTVIKRRVCALSPTDDMYNALSHISKDIKPNDLTTILDTAFKLQYTAIERQRYDMLRQRKDYYRAIGQRSGSVKFESNIGDPTAPCHQADPVTTPNVTSPTTMQKRFIYNNQIDHNDHSKLAINTNDTISPVVGPVTTVSPIGGRHSRHQSINHSMDNKLKLQLDAANKQITALQQQLKEQGTVTSSTSNTPSISPAVATHHTQTATHPTNNTMDARVKYLSNVANSAQREKSRTTVKPQPSTPIIKFTELLDYQLFPCVYMEGYLSKARGVPKDEKLSLFGKRSDGMTAFGDVHRRFFVLFGSFLTYYKQHTARTPTRDECLDMRTCIVTSVDKHELGQWCIRIHNQRETVYMLIAHNQQNRNVWTNILNHATTFKG